MKMRKLEPREIEVKVAQVDKVGGKWCRLLLHKTARTDQDILDETFGPMNWKAEFKPIGSSIYCTISVWDKEKGQWVAKEDVGSSESNFEPEKSAASSAMKRAGTQWGIGRYLYNSPVIFMELYQGECNNGKVKPHFHVDDYTIDEDGEFTSLEIADETGTIRWHMPVWAKCVRFIEKAKNADDLRYVWEHNSTIQRDPTFLKLLSKRKKELNIS